MQVLSPKRVQRSYTQSLSGTPAEVFPLLCPVREADWIEGWEPVRVYSQSGLAEEGCVFLTEDSGQRATWSITRHDVQAGCVEMLKLVPGVTSCKLSIELFPSAAGCEANITYAHTSLGAAGDALVEAFTEQAFGDFMQQWERRLNHFLTTGCMLRDAEG